MKKLTLLLSALMMFGATASFAGDGKGEKKACKDKKEASCCKKGEKKACCKKDGEKSASAEKPASDKK